MVVVELDFDLDPHAVTNRSAGIKISNRLRIEITSELFDVGCVGR